MPLSEHEQRILEEIERRLAEEDPRLVDQVSRTSLYTHLARRIKLAVLAFIAGLVMLMLFWVSVALAVAGFILMLGSAALIYRYLKRIGREHLRAGAPAGGPLTFASLIARLAERFRGQPGAESSGDRTDDPL